MIGRLLTPVLRDRLSANPAVALVGPRQVGKTTLAQSLAARYYDLEQEGDRLRLDLEWDALDDEHGLVVLDEAQAWPEVFSRLRGTIDRHRARKGRFLILGSVSPALMRAVSESLAGRLALVELTPFLQPEIPKVSLRNRWLRGGFPDGLSQPTSRFPQWQRDYLSLLIQRDLPAWGLPGRPQVTERFARMLAAVHGQAWNASRLGQSLGLSHTTVSHYLDYLEGTFLVRRLMPWHSNIGKRLVKSPKVYWRDTGLLHALLGAATYDDLLAQPWVGASWEGFVIEQILGVLAAADRHVEPYYFRTSDGHELDLVFDLDRKRWAVEVKLTSQPSPGDVRDLARKAAMVQATRSVLVSSVAREAEGGGVLSCSLPKLLSRLMGD